MRGYDVIHPIGWDSFGLPAENAAVERSIAADEWTRSNIQHMKGQMVRLGFDFDWSRELSTCEPEYYRWTQEVFVTLHKRGLVAQVRAAARLLMHLGEFRHFVAQAPGWVNWDPVDRTVLANEQVDEQGRSWRSGALVEKRQLLQWYLRITLYAEQLLHGLDFLPLWPEQVAPRHQPANEAP
jgi:leucyl-tRNA synthetase